MKRFNAAAGGLLAASLLLTAGLLASGKQAGCGSPTTGSTSAGAPKGQPVVVGAMVSTTGPPLPWANKRPRLSASCRPR